MYTVITVLIIIASILLTIVVLLQNSKGGGLAANFAAGNQTFGVRQTADFLEKATWTLAIIILVLSILATAFISTKNSVKEIAPIEQSAPEQSVPDFPSLPEAAGDAAETPAE